MEEKLRSARRTRYYWTPAGLKKLDEFMVERSASAVYCPMTTEMLVEEIFWEQQEARRIKGQLVKALREKQALLSTIKQLVKAAK